MAMLPCVESNTKDCPLTLRGDGLETFLLFERVDTAHRGLYSTLKKLLVFYPLKDLLCLGPSDFQN